MLATVTVAPDATVSWLPDIGDPSTETTATVREWAAQREDRLVQPGVWLTIRDGAITAIVEQFVP